MTQEATDRLRQMLAGIEAWQRHPHKRRLSAPRVVWQGGASRLLDFGGTGPAVLAVPSLINRAYILDLGRGHSLMRYLAGRGLRPLLLDWGDAGPDEAAFDLNAFAQHRLVPALHVAASQGPIALLGYCMGGTLAVALAQTQPQHVARLALIGAPWRFSEALGVAAALRQLGRQTGTLQLTQALLAIEQAFGVIPGDLMQLLFAMLDPGLTLAKFRRFAEMPRHSRDARRFVELEDWVNSPVGLPGPAARDILIDWQLRDVTGRGLWRLSGTRIDPARLSMPSLLFCATEDRIAPPSATEPLARAIPGARLATPATGHVGMIVGRASPATVWKPLADFLAPA
ncbi:MAG: alpha/beta fold hydrolase [Pseudomonadota bacterium]